MPPLTYASAFIGLPLVLIKIIFWADYVLPLCCIGYGFYINFRRSSI
jgi:hypothetical protein